MLLLTFTEKSGKTQLMKGVNDLETLMQQMRVCLDTAANDPMQPRAEAVQQILKMARQ